MNDKRTSKQVFSKAKKIIQDRNFSETSKIAANDAINQFETDADSTQAAIDAAERILNDNRFSDYSRSVAASIIAQAKKK